MTSSYVCSLMKDEKRHIEEEIKDVIDEGVKKKDGGVTQRRGEVLNVIKRENMCVVLNIHATIALLL